MEVLKLSIPALNRFASDYIDGKADVNPFFHYNYKDQQSYINRLDDLSKRYFERELLVDHIRQFMDRYPSSIAVDQSLEKLQQKDSVVVIGGQQAGALTGPLFTIHKVISIIKLAKEQEAKLKVPVIPVFWIAGEDHDWHEVNHVYMNDKEELLKKTFPQKVKDKRMVSDVLLDHESCLQWCEEIFEGLGETNHTNELRSIVKEAVEQSETFIDFFAYLVMTLFKDYGLLIVDSGNPQLRELEKNHFRNLIQQAKPINENLLNQQKIMSEQGYSITIEVVDNAANLFYYDQFERILLEYVEEEDLFVGKNGRFQVTREQLLVASELSPQKLSNNVVTRPLMQEWLFPTLAFVAGPGEIAYWGELKKVFESFSMTLPIVVPRLTFTLLERDVQMYMNDLHLDFEKAIKDGIQSDKDDFIESINDEGVHNLLQTTQNQLSEHYKELTLKVSKIDKGLLGLVDKNEHFILSQLQFLQKKVNERLELKNHVVLSKYDRIASSLRPFNGPQERIWNVIPFMNQYGLDVIDQILAQPFDYGDEHIVIKF